jgi:hypothetical protein
VPKKKKINIKISGKPIGINHHKSAVVTFSNKLNISQAYLLATRVLELGTTQSLDDGGLVVITSTH